MADKRVECPVEGCGYNTPNFETEAAAISLLQIHDRNAHPPAENRNDRKKEPPIPEILSFEPTEQHESEFKFWKKKFENYLRECGIIDEMIKLSRLVNRLDHKVY